MLPFQPLLLTYNPHPTQQKSPNTMCSPTGPSPLVREPTSDLLGDHVVLQATSITSTTTSSCLRWLARWRHNKSSPSTTSTTTTTTTKTTTTVQTTVNTSSRPLDTIPEHTRCTRASKQPAPPRRVLFVGGGRLPCGGGRAAPKADFPYQDGYDSDDDEDISEDLLEEVGGDFIKARRRHYDTLSWRHHHHIDDILDDETPSPMSFAQILHVWPRWLQGRTQDGDVVLYEELDKLRGAALREARVTPDAWSCHLGLIGEFVTRCMDHPQDLKVTRSSLPPNNWHDPYKSGPPTPRITMVLSFAGIISAAFFADGAVRKAIRTWSHILSAHYPGLVHRILLVNVPPTLSPAALLLLRPLRLLAPAWRNKISLVLDADSDHQDIMSSLSPGHRALLTSAGLSPEKNILRDLGSIIEPTQLSQAVCPGLGLDKRSAEGAVEWMPLRRLVQANAPVACQVVQTEEKGDEEKTGEEEKEEEKR